jgi:hypothetical protein
MGSLSSLASIRAISLTYSRSASFDRQTLSPAAFRIFFDGIMHNAAWIG